MGAQAYKLEFYVPSTHVEEVKHAIFSAGAGVWGGYAQCCWQTQGRGQFLPLLGSKPYLGRAGEVEVVEETKVEVLVSETCLQAVIAALKSAHPYETCAFYYWRVQLD